MVEDGEYEGMKIGNSVPQSWLHIQYTKLGGTYKSAKLNTTLESKLGFTYTYEKIDGKKTRVYVFSKSLVEDLYKRVKIVNLIKV